MSCDIVCDYREVFKLLTGRVEQARKLPYGTPLKVPPAVCICVHLWHGCWALDVCMFVCMFAVHRLGSRS